MATNRIPKVGDGSEKRRRAATSIVNRPRGESVGSRSRDEDRVNPLLRIGTYQRHRHQFTPTDRHGSVVKATSSLSCTYRTIALSGVP
ncbi:conserved hypothetical protein [Ricinus communis]|uniref:Uncharacterized protein n=1 Tax=Ricinus communis TaxID=3988 RepID=B9RPV9_RICCO|nr:conserved hypothetical protein [Ricinus communis]